MRHVSSLAAVLILVAGCETIQWSDDAPDTVRRVWIETSDDIIIGFEQPDTITVDRSHLRHVWYHEEEDYYSERLCPIRRVSMTKGTIIVFCGAENVDHIAKYRYEFLIGPNGWFALISEIVPTGWDSNHDGWVQHGRFFAGASCCG